MRNLHPPLCACRHRRLPLHPCRRRPLVRLPLPCPRRRCRRRWCCLARRRPCRCQRSSAPLRGKRGSARRRCDSWRQPWSTRALVVLAPAVVARCLVPRHHSPPPLQQQQPLRHRHQSRSQVYRRMMRSTRRATSMMASLWLTAGWSERQRRRTRREMAAQHTRHPARRRCWCLRKRQRLRRHRPRPYARRRAVRRRHHHARPRRQRAHRLRALRCLLRPRGRWWCHLASLILAPCPWARCCTPPSR